MAAASYTTDLTTISDATTTTNWTEPTWATAGGTATAEVDYFIQGTGCISKTFNATGLGGLHYNNGAGVTIPTDGAYVAWIYYAAPNAIATDANGGQRLTIGSAAGDYKSWYVGGSGSYAYGGWVNKAVNPTITADDTRGTPTATLRYFGYIVNSVNAVFRGNPFGVDAIRYGRCEARINGGDLANGYATFAGFAAQNDSVTNRWGLVQSVAGGYLWKGLMTLGYTSAVDFRDSNVQILVDNTPKVTANFNKIEIRQATSRVDWTGVSITALGTTSKGRLEVIDDADVNLTSCTFTDMDTFIFKPNSTIASTTFRHTGLITPGGATMTGSTITSSSATQALVINTAVESSAITYCTFTGNNRAIQITAPGTYTFSGHQFSGNTYDVENSSGGLVTINATNGCNVSTFINTGGGTTVINNQVTLTLSGIVNGSEVRIFTHGTTTELGGVESVTGNQFVFTYNYTPNTYVDIVVHNLYYLYYRLENVLLSSTNATIPVQQLIDRQYFNPV